MTQLLLWLLVAAISSFIQASCGFGFAILGMAFLPLLTDSVPLAAAICTIIALWCSAANCVIYRQNINARIMLPCLIGYMVMQPILTRVSMDIPTDIIKACLGFMLFLIAIVFLFVAKNIRLSASWGAGLSLGLLSGVMGGLFGISGPPAAIYLLCTTKDKNEYLGTAAVYFVAVSIYSTIVRISLGILTMRALPYIGVGMIGLVIGFLAGHFATKHIDSKRLQRCIYAFIGLTGLWYVANYFI